MNSRRILHPLLASLIVGSALGVAACGSGGPASTAGDRSATVRRAAAADTTCPEPKSDARYITIRNNLSTDITLDVPRHSWSCAYYGGTSTPARLDGYTIGPGAALSGVRLEVTRKDYYDSVKADFGLRIRAGATTLGNLTLTTMGYGGKRNLAIAMNGNWWCIRPMELLDAAGNPIWVRSTHCDETKDWELEITDTKPS